LKTRKKKIEIHEVKIEKLEEFVNQHNITSAKIEANLTNIQDILKKGLEK
jgi:hypothetical protein